MTHRTKQFRGAPFGTQTSRFDVSGVHPQNKMPGTYTQVPYCKIATSKERKLLGPGTYVITSGDFIPRNVTEKARGPNWKRAYELAKIHAIPHMLYRVRWEHQRELVRQMGPGKYSSRDFIQEFNDKPSSKKGICQALSSRFPRENKFHGNLPGPGSYGKGGVPCALYEEKKKESAGKVGVMDSTGHKYNSGSIAGSGLAPCRYSQPSSINETLDKVVGTRGPYDLFTGDRHELPKHVLQKTHLGPGKYQIKSFLDEKNEGYYQKCGKFSTMAQHPERPADRVFTILSQCPHDKDDPGPGHYEPEQKAGSAATTTQSYGYRSSKQPFNSSARRFTKRAEAYFSGNTNPVGVGQYDILRWKQYQHTNGYEGVFNSNAPRLPVQVDAPRELLLSERLHPKAISLDRKLFEPLVVSIPS